MRDPVKLEAMTQAFENKVKPTSRLTTADVPAGGPGHSREDGAGITSSVPIERKSMSGAASPVWPSAKGTMTFYGKSR